MKTYIAMYMGTPPKPGDNRSMDPEAIQKGMSAWQKWMEDNAAAITDIGGPLGKTKKIGPDGVSDIRNEMTGYVVFQAEDHDAAAALFENHPHFSVFPGDHVEVMEVMPMPGG